MLIYFWLSPPFHHSLLKGSPNQALLGTVFLVWSSNHQALRSYLEDVLRRCHSSNWGCHYLQSTLQTLFSFLPVLPPQSSNYSLLSEYGGLGPASWSSAKTCSAKFNIAKVKLKQSGSYLWMLRTATVASFPTADMEMVKIKIKVNAGTAAANNVISTY